MWLFLSVTAKCIFSFTQRELVSHCRWKTDRMSNRLRRTEPIWAGNWIIIFHFTLFSSYTICIFVSWTITSIKRINNFMIRHAHWSIDSNLIYLKKKRNYFENKIKIKKFNLHFGKWCLVWSTRFQNNEQCRYVCQSSQIEFVNKDECDKMYRIFCGRDRYTYIYICFTIMQQPVARS